MRGLVALVLAGWTSSATAQVVGPAGGPTGVCQALVGQALDLRAPRRGLADGQSPIQTCPVVRSRQRRLSFVEVMVGVVIPPIGLLMLASAGDEAYTVHLLPLSLAVRWGSQDAVRALMEAGASPMDADGQANLAIEAAIVADLGTLGSRWTHQLLGDHPVPSRLLCGEPDQLDRLRTHAVLRRRLVAAGMDEGGRDCDGATWLHRAAEKGDNIVVMDIIDRGQVPVSLVDDRGRTAVFSAARGDEWDVVSLLVEQGASLVGAGGQTSSVLHHAARHGQLVWVNRALEAGDPVDGRDESGDTPLVRAVEFGQTDVVVALLNRGADPTTGSDRPGEMLADAAKRGWLDIVAALLDAGLAVDAPGTFGRTALQLAWERDQFAIAALLVAHGANPMGRRDPVFSSHPAPLNAALVAHRDDWVALLLPAASDHQRQDALVHVLIHDDLASATMLLDAGASPDAALASLSGPGDLDKAMWLRERGAQYGEGALLDLIPYAPVELVALALADGARWNAASPSQPSPVPAAVEAKNAVVLALLVEHGAMLGAHGAEALERALWRDELAWSADLLRLGTSVTRESLHTAVERGHAELLPAMLDRARLPPRDLRRLRRWARRRGAPERSRAVLDDAVQSTR